MPDIEQDTTADIGAVQGTAPDATDAAAPAEGLGAATGGLMVGVPDAGEIEWAGGLVGKAPGGG